MEYVFTLKFQLSDNDAHPTDLVERLGAAGCDDALVGIGRPGRLALEFTREAIDASSAIRSALADVRQAVPSARLVEVTPDLVGLTDAAQIVGVSRQNMRKLMLAHSANFPLPVHEGNASLWHLADLLVWMKARGYRFPASLLELAVVARQLNAVRELEALGLLEVETVSPAGIGLVLRQACIDGLARGHRSSGVNLPVSCKRRFP